MFHRLVRHLLAAIRTSIDVAVATRLVANLAEVELEHVDGGRVQRTQGGLHERGLEARGRERAGQGRQLHRRVGKRGAARLERGQWTSHAFMRSCVHGEGRGLAHIETSFTTFLIWMPCTSDAPPRMAAATWTASVIWSASAPLVKQSWA